MVFTAVSYSIEVHIFIVLGNRGQAKNIYSIDCTTLTTKYAVLIKKSSNSQPCSFFPNSKLIYPAIIAAITNTNKITKIPIIPILEINNKDIIAHIL